MIALRPVVVAEQSAICGTYGHRDLHCKKNQRGCSHIVVDRLGDLMLCGCQRETP